MRDFLLYYHPLTKFVKVMFLHMSVILSKGGLPHCMLGYTPPPRDQRQAPPGADTPQSRHTPSPGSRHPPGADPPELTPPQEQTPPGTVHAGRYVQKAGGMHPTGMQSCFPFFFTLSCPLSKMQVSPWVSYQIQKNIFRNSKQQQNP